MQTYNKEEKFIAIFHSVKKERLVLVWFLNTKNFIYVSICETFTYFSWMCIKPKRKLHFFCSCIKTTTLSRIRFGPDRFLEAKYFSEQFLICETFFVDRNAKWFCSGSGSRKNVYTRLYNLFDVLFLFEKSRWSSSLNRGQNSSIFFFSFQIFLKAKMTFFLYSFFSNFRISVFLFYLLIKVHMKALPLNSCWPS